MKCHLTILKKAIVLIDFRLACTAQILAELGARLRQQRLMQTLTQQDLATRAGVALSAVKKLESGRNATLLTTIKIAQALSLTDDLKPLFEPKPTISIAELARTELALRQRARPRRKL